VVSADRIRKLLDLDTLELPKRPRVIDIVVRPIIDQLGHEEVEVTVVLDDAATDAELRWRHLQPIYAQIHERVGAIEDGPFPYVEFLRRSELDE
jgi:hypothetical protein